MSFMLITINKLFVHNWKVLEFEANSTLCKFGTTTKIVAKVKLGCFHNPAAIPMLQQHKGHDLGI
jgi:hypothetical protein